MQTVLKTVLQKTHNLCVCGHGTRSVPTTQLHRIESTTEGDMKTGRNAPCPCGSGKKYKMCCLRRDQQSRSERERLAQAQRAESERAEAERAALVVRHDAELRAAARMTNDEEPPPRDPHLEAFDSRWTEFQEQDLAGQIRLFLETLNDATLMDDEMAFEMLMSIHGQTVESGMREKFAELVGELRERLPDVYAQGQHYYLHFQIIDAVVEGKAQAVHTLAKELAETAEDDADTFFQAVNCLAYHGYLAALVDATGIAWPIVEDSPNLLDPDEVAQWGADCAVFECLERNPQLDGLDPELATRVKYFFSDVDADALARHVDRLSGRITRDWTPNDLELESSGRRRQHKKSAKNSGRSNLHELGAEFVGYLHREKNVPFTKALVGANNITNYLLRRCDGDLDESEYDFDEDSFSRRNRKLRRARTATLHPLCPDHATLDRYLGRLLHFLNPHFYDVAATFELLPLWLIFLEQRGLIEAYHREASLDDLQALRNQLLDLWKTKHDDPTLAQNLQHWPDVRAPSLVGTAALGS